MTFYKRIAGIMIVGLFLLSNSPALSAQAKRDSLMQIIERTDDPTTLTSLFRAISRICNTDDACHEEVSKVALSISEFQYATYRERVGFRHYVAGDIKRAFEVDRNTVAFAKKHDLNEIRAQCYNRIGHLHLKELSVDSSFYYLFESIRVFDEVGEEYTKWIPYFRLGEAYSVLKDLENAEKYYEKAYEFTCLKNIRMDKGYVLFHVMKWFINHPNPEKYSHYLGEYIAFMESGDPSRRHSAMLNLFGSDEETIENLESLIVDIENGANIGSICYIYSTLGKVYLMNKNFSMAEMRLVEALEKCDSIGKRTHLIEVHQNLMATYDTLGDYGNALENSIRLITLKDSLYQNEKVAAVYEYKEKFEVQKKNQELAEQEILVQKRNAQLILLLAGGSLLLILGLSYYNRYRNKALLEKAAQQQKIKDLQQHNKLVAMEGLVKGQEKERKRIAKDLHDGLGGLLTTVKAHFESVQPSNITPDDNRIISNANKLLDNACMEVRKVSHNLMPYALELSGLQGAIEDLAEEVRSKGTAAEVIFEGFSVLIDDSEKIMIFRIVQELINNAMKHADAKNILIQLIRFDDQTSILVEDDGKGFDYQEGQLNAGIGLTNIKSRVHYMNGEIQIDTTPNRGTSITILLPTKTLIHD